MNGNSLESKILVLGSPTWEVALVPDETPAPRAGPSEHPNGVARMDFFKRYPDWVGAPIIREMIREALGEDPGVDNFKSRLMPEDPDNNLKEEREITTVFKSFPKKSGGKKPKPTTLRIHKNYASRRSGTDELKKYIEKSITCLNESSIVVVYDQDCEFHQTLKEILAKDATAAGSKPLLVIALANEIYDDLPGTIPRKLSEPRDTVVLVTATGLRKWGLDIVEYGSIEETVREVVGFSKKEPLQKILEQCDHLIIIFEETGAIYIRREKSGLLEGSIHFCPNFDRVAQMDVEVYGRSPGRLTIALASVVRQLALKPKGEGPLNLDPAVRLAVAAYNLHFGKGFEKEKSPFETMKKALSLQQREDLLSRLENEKPEKREQEFFISSLAFHVDDRIKEWSRLTEVLPAGDKKEVKRILYRIVMNGVEQAFRAVEEEKANQSGDSRAPESPWFPKASITCPYLEVGSIKTFDPEEIAGFTALAKLIRKYLGDDKWTTPLSIAVFGEPGSGKSFGVKELLKSINPDIGAPLTFNLAQFDSVATLTEAFHQVQDRGLSSEDVPLVIFDEFDCKFGQTPLGWLKYFLAPMNDGAFRGQSGEYRVGRAIFLFAGGTATSFREFRDPLEAREISDDPKSAKLPDFVSRLHGFLDVVDINPAKQSSPDFEPDYRRIQRSVRRAVILRSLLLRHAKPIFTPGDGGHDIANIHERVIDAFLNVPRYEHGVRSMESVIRLCRWIDGQLLESSLPAVEQLKMHAPGFWNSSETAP